MTLHLYEWLIQIMRSDTVEQINGFSTAVLSALFQAEGSERFLVRGAFNAATLTI